MTGCTRTPPIIATPKRYFSGECRNVDAALEKIGFREGEFTSWWEVSDALLSSGAIAAAETAQSRAVPILSDAVAASNTEQVATLYGEAENGLDAPVLRTLRRVVSEAVRDFPILASESKLNLTSARVAAIDLGDVTVREGGEVSTRQAALMYLLGRHLLTRDWYITEDDARDAVRTNSLPKTFLEFHVQQAKLNHRIPKQFCMDEFNRASGIPAVQWQVLRDIREGRKHNVRIALASQLLEDFSSAVLDMASTVFVFNAPSENAICRIAETYGLDDEERAVLNAELTGPTARGTPVFCMFRHKGGVCRQKLYLTLGSSELWALSTTSEDVALRECLASELGPAAARVALAARFPGGSAKREIETRIARRAEENSTVSGDRGRSETIESIAAEIASSYRELSFSVQ